MYGEMYGACSDECHMPAQSLPYPDPQCRRSLSISIIRTWYTDPAHGQELHVCRCPARFAADVQRALFPVAQTRGTDQSKAYKKKQEHIHVAASGRKGVAAATRPERITK